MSQCKRPVVDFDQHSEGYAKNWRGILKELRETYPVAWSEAHGGFWVISKHEDILRVEQNPQLFSSDNDINQERQGGKGIRIPSSQIRLRLMESDPPEHTALRKLEAPFVSVTALEPWFELTQQLVDQQIDSVIESGQADLCHDIAIAVPAQVTLRLLGVPTEEWHDYLAGAVNSYLPPDHPNFPNAERERITRRLVELMRQRREDRRDDVISALVHAEVDGKPLAEQDALGMLQSLAFGGFDTTAATILNTLCWLEERPELHAALIDDDKLLERTVDEMLRYFPPVLGGLARTVTEDTELRGQQLHQGDRVLLMYNSGNFDSDRFECPMDVQLDRRNAKQHLSFGAGPHRCLGALLGAREVQIVVRSVLKRLPDYRIDHERARRFPRAGGVNGWLTMPITFTPGHRLNSK